MKSKFSDILEAIHCLESAFISLKQSIDIVASVSPSMEIPGPVGTACSSKLKRISSAKLRIWQNEGSVCSSWRGKNYRKTTLGSSIHGSIEAVERSFSLYKTLLTDNRKRFAPDNLEMWLVIYCNLIIKIKIHSVATYIWAGKGAIQLRVTVTAAAATIHTGIRRDNDRTRRKKNANLERLLHHRHDDHKKMDGRGLWAEIHDLLRGSWIPSQGM